MSAKIDEHYIEALRKYYVASGDTLSKIVDFPDNSRSPFLRSHDIIGENDFTIIDAFGGRKPVVFTYRFLVDGHSLTPFAVGIVPDSNVVSYLHQLVTDEGGACSTTPRGHSTQRLLKKLAEYSLKGWDFNPCFYLMEALAKKGFDKIFPRAREYAESMLKIQTMDDEIYLKSGLIVSDPENLQPGSGSFENASHNLAKGISELEFEEMWIFIQATYAALLKIGLIGLERSDSFRKVEKTLEFFHNDLGVLLLREAVLSCLHFEGKSGQLIPLQVGAKGVRRKLLASAWDLVLLRLPEHLMGNESNEVTSIYYICTAEKALQKLGRMFVVGRVSSIKEGHGHLPSMVGVNYDLLSQEVGTRLTNQFYSAYQQRSGNRAQRTPRDLAEISRVVENLEHQASKVASLD
jgi:hypothetical protein